MKFKHAKPLALAAAAVAISAAGGAEAAVSPEKQISFLAEQAAVWGADAFYRDWLQDDGWCAITDLDGNKRLELFFVRAVRKKRDGLW